MTARFDDALRGAIDVISRNEGVLAPAGRVVLVRDLFGRIRVAFENEFELPLEVEDELRQATGAYFAPGALSAPSMLAPKLVFDSTDARPGVSSPRVEVIDRVVTGAEWQRAPLPNLPPTPPRSTLFGIKGGVGRSTALIAWARHLASLRKKVLVFDLDLESPGVSSSLLPKGSSPDFGVVDWLVEDAVDNADEELVRRMVYPSPLADGTAGDILVVGCGDYARGTYVDKLSRSYLDVPGTATRSSRSFADRIGEMVDAVERHVNPDVVLLDSRSGLHDLAGIATTRLGAMSFLFAVGSRQTWDGYRTLLRQWSARPKIAQEVRERIKMVAAQVPETAQKAYLDRFVDETYQMFSELMYEEIGPENPDAFNFDIQSTDAPHYPLRIEFSRSLQGDWDPLRADVTAEQVHGAMGSFLVAATELVLPDDEQEIYVEDSED